MNAYLPEMAAVISSADLVPGSRYLRGVNVVNRPLHRIILSSFANRYIQVGHRPGGTRLHHWIPVLAFAAKGLKYAREIRSEPHCLFSCL